MESFYCNSEELASIIFPAEIRKNAMEYPVKGTQSHKESVVSYRNCCFQITERFKEVYNIDCVFVIGDKSWDSKLCEGGVIKFYCPHCSAKRTGATERPPVDSLVAVAICKKDKKDQLSVKVERVFFHNSHLFESKCPPIYKFNGYFMMEFPLEEIFGNTYEAAKVKINRYSYKDVPGPPGDLIDFMTDANHRNNGHPAEDRKYCVLPSSHYPTIKEGEHRNCLIRLEYFLCASFNLTTEMAPTVAIPKNDWHLYPSEVSLIFGGHHKGDDDKPVVHQPIHEDHSMKDYAQEDLDKLEDKFLPASFLIPLETERELHFRALGCVQKIQRGQIVVFDKTTLHAGHTWKVIKEEHARTDWKVAMHGHLDSKHSPREHNHVDHSWDFGASVANAACAAQYGNIFTLLDCGISNLRASLTILEEIKKEIPHSKQYPPKGEDEDEAQERELKTKQGISEMFEILDKALKTKREIETTMKKRKAPPK